MSGRDRVRGDVGVHVAAGAAVVRAGLADGLPAFRPLEQGQGLGPSAPGHPGWTRRPGRAGLVAFRCRLGERPGPQRGLLTGPNPTDRGKKGSKIHLVTDRPGPPVAVAISAANAHDSLALQPLVASIPPARSRRGPRRRRPDKLHGDKGYDYPHLRRWLRERGIAPRIARRGIETSQRLERHRWVVERTTSWLAGCRRLHRRYESKPEHFLAFTAISTSLINYRRLAE